MKKHLTVTVFAVNTVNEFSAVKLLGRTAREYLKENLAEDENFSVIYIADEKIPDVYPAADYYLRMHADMPLISKGEIFQIAEAMEKRRLGGVRLSSALMFKNRSSLSGTPPVININVRRDSFLRADSSASVIKIHDLMRKKITDRLIADGVIIYDASSVSIDSTVTFKKGCMIHPFNVIKGATSIGCNNIIDSGCIIENAFIGDSNRIVQSNLSDCVIGSGCSVGPFATLRKGASIGDNCRIGDYVEVKNSIIHNGAKAAHLAYIGDAEVGSRTNIGCGTVFANYNGKIKQKTTVGSDVFIGANTNLIAPLDVGSDSFIAAGSTITDDIPPNAFAIAREKQVVKKSYADKYGKKK
ncbi:MAG: hypothetical protein LBT30_02340 [Clostridiales bacterium]|jgi:NDP-sugar pyrophosphorylase family protein|nr:hypothetical protein [Clostridiales bacterium]